MSSFIQFMAVTVLHREMELVLELSISFSDCAETTLSGDVISKLEKENENMPAQDSWLLVGWGRRECQRNTTPAATL
jgi:hypothetical protein